MEIKGLYTKNGGKVHVHFGSKCITNLWGRYYEITDLNLVNRLSEACRYVNAADTLAAIRHTIDPNTVGILYTRDGIAPKINPAVIPSVENTGAAPVPAVSDSEIRSFQQSVVKRLLAFFSEFRFNPAARFVNTMSRQESSAAMTKYVSNYVRLINNPDMNNIIEKMKSAEFTELCNDMLKYPAEKPINERLVIYFGDAGTGKTTQAVQEYPDAPVVPCNASMLPDELLRTFDFNDANGNPVFKPSTLRNCMEAGKPVIFDEINLLGFDCLRLLQTITDRKDTIDFNGETIVIKPGFKIIGTMNLIVNEQVYNLPEPLVDRAGEIKEFTLSAKDLTAYAFG